MSEPFESEYQEITPIAPAPLGSDGNNNAMHPRFDYGELVQLDCDNPAVKQILDRPGNRWLLDLYLAKVLDSYWHPTLNKYFCLVTPVYGDAEHWLSEDWFYPAFSSCPDMDKGVTMKLSQLPVASHITMGGTTFKLKLFPSAHIPDASAVPLSCKQAMFLLDGRSVTKDYFAEDRI